MRGDISDAMPSLPRRLYELSLQVRYRSFGSLSEGLRYGTALAVSQLGTASMSTSLSSRLMHYLQLLGRVRSLWERQRS